jgi:ribA/ribD-fused uncharacterized protein
MKMNKEELINRYNSGEKIDFIFFWGNNPSKEINESCFSQWFPWHNRNDANNFSSQFIVDDVIYDTAEKHMMAQKALLFDDENSYQNILKCKSPYEAKTLGRAIKNFNNEIWKKHRFDIVKQGNLAKFNQNEDLKNFLLSTGNNVLVEASPYDRIWGIGLDKNNKKVLNPNEWKGLNLLGFVLMEVRKELAK